VYVNYLNIILYRQLGASRMWQSQLYFTVHLNTHIPKTKPPDWAQCTQCFKFSTNCRYHEIQTLLSFDIPVTTQTHYSLGVLLIS